MTTSLSRDIVDLLHDKKRSDALDKIKNIFNKI